MFDELSVRYFRIEASAAVIRHMESARHPSPPYGTSTMIEPVDDDLIYALCMIIAPWTSWKVSHGGTHDKRIVQTNQGWLIQQRQVQASDYDQPR